MGKKGPVPRPLIDRLAEKFRIGDGCWEWEGYRMPNGYGKLTVVEDRSNLAHRLVYEEYVGAVPEGLELDHVCRNRGCVNPAHLEPVTRSENLNRSPLVQYQRELKAANKAKRLANRPYKGYGSRNAAKTHCPQGHPYDDENTRWYRNSRRCKACDRDRANAAYRRKKGGSP